MAIWIQYERCNFEKSELQIEYNWTDQRIYMHKYDINDFYNHQLPLGFWAGPHAEELLFYYLQILEIEFSNSFFKNKKRVEYKRNG